jgi:hypothetical protein
MCNALIKKNKNKKKTPYFSYLSSPLSISYSLFFHLQSSKPSIKHLSSPLRNMNPKTESIISFLVLT